MNRPPHSRARGKKIWTVKGLSYGLCGFICKNFIKKYILTQYFLPFSMPFYTFNSSAFWNSYKSNSFYWSQFLYKHLHRFFNCFFFIHIFYSFHLNPSFSQKITGLPHHIFTLCFKHFLISWSSQLIKGALDFSAKAICAASATPKPILTNSSALSLVLSILTSACTPNLSKIVFI